MPSQQPSRNVATFALLGGAVVFGMVLAGGLDLSATGAAAPIAAAAPAAPGETAAPARVGLSYLPSFADLAEKVNPAVVSIEASTIERADARRGSGRGGSQDPFQFFFGPRGGGGQQPNGDDDREYRSDAGGSGFVVSADGYVVTNNHVIEGATKLRVRLAERYYDATVKGADPATDLALLKIEAGRNLAFLPLGDSDRLRVGDYVMAIGNPLLLDHTVTVGVVSAKGRSIGLMRDSSFENFIQTDAAINRGNSGGPLVNLAGEVVGIATAMNGGAENIGFAVPVSTLEAVLPQLREKGKVSRGYIGVNISNIDFDRAQAFGLSEAGGALVTQVVDGSPADKAGVEHGDVVLAVDGNKVNETRDLIDYVSAQGPGKKVELDILRDGKRLHKTVELTERAGDTTAEDETPEREGSKDLGWLGLEYQDLTPALRQSLGLASSVEGVLVREVEASSPLYDEGVGDGDLITEINGTPVTSVKEFERVVGAAPKGSFLRLYLRRVSAQGQGQGQGSGRQVNYFAIVRVP
ncbi:MAG: Do family serine endopeptidase [Thermoanaerobaculia bacterium]